MSAAALQDVQNAPLALIGSARAGRRTLLDMLLSAKGYEIAACEDGPAVLEFLKENQPAIAIFDHDLPGMDGREICSRMRFIARLAETPIAIVTPPVDEMGGAADFETFTETTTADIVEAEPLGKKRLIERLENVIRDQRGVANDGKMTIAIPTVVPPIPEFEGSAKDEQVDEMDVFVDDDVDIEIDVARAIYSNDGSFDTGERQQRQEVAAHEEVAVDEEAAGSEVAASSDGTAPSRRTAEGDIAEPGQGHEVEVAMQIDDNMNDAAEADPRADEYAQEMFLDENPDEQLGGATQADDIDLFMDESDSASLPGPLADPELSEQPGQIAGPEQNTQLTEADWPQAVANDDAALVEEIEDAAAAAELGDAPWNDPEPVGVAALHGTDSAGADSPVTGPVGLADEGSGRDGHQNLQPILHVSRHGAAHDEERASRPAEVERSPAGIEPESTCDEVDDDDLAATIEAAIEAVNLAAMEEASLRAAEADEVEAGPAPKTEESVQTSRPQIEISPEIAEKAAELEVIETLGGGAKDYAATSDDDRVESPSAAVGGQEEGEAEVLNEERANMQALIAEQAERIENLQERNVLLRQELEQRKAEDAQRHEERANLQALIKEQTEAINNLQQRNVQLRQELEQYRAEEAKRDSERAFLQSHTSEQAETIAKLQQLNALLRQELEQRKADEAPLRDFLQRLLDRDEQNSAYQEAMRAEIISLTRENS
ncbi:MAG TPA: response regulator [Trueperaceae bacterium]